MRTRHGGPSITMSTVSPNTVAVEFSSNCNPTSSGDSRWAAIPEPTTTVTSRPEPTNSASIRRGSGTGRCISRLVEASRHESSSRRCASPSSTHQSWLMSQPGSCADPLRCQPARNHAWSWTLPVGDTQAALKRETLPVDSLRDAKALAARGRGGSRLRPADRQRDRVPFFVTPIRATLPEQVPKPTCHEPPVQASSVMWAMHIEVLRGDALQPQDRVRAAGGHAGNGSRVRRRRDLDESGATPDLTRAAVVP